MQQHSLKSGIGAKPRRKRIGRGDGSGRGSSAGRGMKGQKSRSGGGVRAAFQGGQNSLVKSLPMVRGFTNIFRQEYNVINLDRLVELSQDGTVTPQLLVERGVLKNLKRPIKILGRGELERPLRVKAHKFSKSAREKIEAAGGTTGDPD